MFASLVVEQEPLQWHGFPAAFETWIRIMGGFSLFALLVYLIVRLIRGPAQRGPRVPWLGFLLGSKDAVARYKAGHVIRGLKWPVGQAILFRWLLLVMLAGYAIWIAMIGPLLLSALFGGMEAGTRPSQPLGSEELRRYILDVSAACALLAVALPLLADLLRLRWSWRRIWALSKLSFKEAVRRKVPWVFSAFVLVFLFATWFMPYKAEDQVRNYVLLVYLTSMILFLFAASLLAAFSLPADMRNQTIHTIVTKPVERFEIVMGRFIGYTMLMSVLLAIITSAGLLYMFREIDRDAQFESMRARVPVFGDLTFRGKEGDTGVGVNVGREWDYRSYIMGGPNSAHRAVWLFNEIPAELGSRAATEVVPCEFSLDIFRTVKGEEGKPVFCTFAFTTRNWDPRLDTEYREARKEAGKIVQAGDRRAVIEKATSTIRGDTPSDAEVKAFTEDREGNAVAKVVDRLLAEKYGIYEITNQGIVDYHTQDVKLPAALFKNIFGTAAKQPSPATPARQGEDRIPLLSASVKCESAGQYVGAAKHDLYLLAAEGSFAWNFLKGAIGLWMRVCLVIALAVTCSTYLSGVIAWLTTVFLYIAGFCQDYVKNLAEGTNPEGGPLASIIKLVNKQSIAAQIEQSPGAHIAQGTDTVFRGIFKIALYVFPDVNRLDWTEHVKEGFNIGGTEMIFLHLLFLLGYLAPCALVAYYLMKSREVAA